MPKLTVTQNMPEGHKYCTKCRTPLLISQFHRDAGSPDGHQRWCKECLNRWRRDKVMKPEFRAKRLQRQREWHARNKVAHMLVCRKSEVKRKYGVDWSDYQTLVTPNRCALCGTGTPRGQGSWHVDHCHDTGKVRGILCHLCNTRLGTYQLLVKQIGEDRIKAYIDAEDFRNALDPSRSYAIHP